MHAGAPAATARSSPGATTSAGNATCRRSRPGSPTSRSPAGRYHTVARRSDGSVVAWGDNTYGQCNVPPLPAGLAYVEIARGRLPHASRAAATARSSPGGQRLRPVQRARASGRARLRRGRGGLAPHRRAAQRRLGRRVGRQRQRPVQRPALPAGLDLRRGRGGLPAHRRAAQRRLGRRVGRQLLGQCNVPALPAGSPTSRSRRATGTASRGAATARSSPGATTPTASATCPRSRPGLTYVEVAAGVTHGRAPQRRLGRRVGMTTPTASATSPRFPAGSPTSRSSAGGTTRHGRRAAATARSSPGETTPTASATCPRCPAGLTYVEVAAGGGHSVARRSDGSVVAWGENGSASATFRRCRPASPTSRSRRTRRTRGAPQRRVDRRLGIQRARPVQRPRARARVLAYVEVAPPAVYTTIARYEAALPHRDLLHAPRANCPSRAACPAIAAERRGKRHARAAVHRHRHRRPQQPERLPPLRRAAAGAALVRSRAERWCVDPPLKRTPGQSSSFGMGATWRRHAAAPAHIGCSPTSSVPAGGSGLAPCVTVARLRRSNVSRWCGRETSGSNASIIGTNRRRSSTRSGYEREPRLAGGLEPRGVASGGPTAFVPPASVSGESRAIAREGSRDVVPPIAQYSGNGRFDSLAPRWDPVRAPSRPAPSPIGCNDGLDGPGERPRPRSPAGATRGSSTAAGARSHSRMWRRGCAIPWRSASDGSLVAWGSSEYGECNVPALPAGLFLRRGRGEATGTWWRYRSDGSAVAWGSNAFGKCNVPPPASKAHLCRGSPRGHLTPLAIRSDGAPASPGDPIPSGQCNVPAPAQKALVHRRCGRRQSHRGACRSDGVGAWPGATTSSASATLPPPPSGLVYVEVAVGSNHKRGPS